VPQSLLVPAIIDKAASLELLPSKLIAGVIWFRGAFLSIDMYLPSLGVLFSRTYLLMKDHCLLRYK
jgi:hypothetical protein